MSDTNEADILFPDKPITLAGENLHVKEFTYLQGLKAAALAQPLLAGLLELAKDAAKLDISALDTVIGTHAEIWTQLLALAIGKDAQFVEQLRDSEGMTLSMMFWEVNGPFLLRRVVFAKRFGDLVNHPAGEN